jgi:hypothetical protein
MNKAKPTVPPMAEPTPEQNGQPAEAPAERDETPLILPVWQAQEILNYLGQCPAGQVYPLIGYLLAAGTKEA